MMKQFRYMLRKSMNIWKPEENIKELKEYCQKYDIDEVVWFSDCEDFNHVMTPVEILAEYIPWFTKAKVEFDSIGVKSSIHPWITLNHGDRGKDARSVHPDMKMMVNWSGEEGKATPCPLSPAWKEWISESFRLCASFKPEVIWVEDDFRTFNHSPVEFGCFCSLHLDRFSEIVGECVSREKLIEAILRPGEAHPWRALWMDMSGEVMVENAKMLEQVVHKESPYTSLALMCSQPENHSVEGRKWHQLLGSLAGDKTPLVRPGTGEYMEVIPMDHYYFFNMTRRVLACVPDSTRPCPESENFTYTLFNKPLKTTRIQFGYTALLGAEDITVNLYNHLGTPMAAEPEFVKMMKDTKPLLSSIISHESELVRDIGVGLHHDHYAPCTKVLDESSVYSNLIERTDNWGELLQFAGIPVTYKKSIVNSFTGQSFRNMSSEEIISYLSGPILLDGKAASVLCELGYGSYIGIASAEKQDYKSHGIKAERVQSGAIIDLINVCGQFYKVDLLPLTKVISNFVDSYAENILPAFISFENEIGGKIVIYLGNLDGSYPGATDYSKFNDYRSIQLFNILKWLSDCKNTFRNKSGPYFYTLQREYRDYHFIGMVNLSYDRSKSIKFEISLPANKSIIKCLAVTDEGIWYECGKSIKIIDNSSSSDVIYEIELDKSVDSVDFTAVKLYI